MSAESPDQLWLDALKQYVYPLPVYRNPDESVNVERTVARLMEMFGQEKRGGTK